ncbi:MAG: FHA domain-containing protein [Pseudomonadota bacterium]
MRTLVVGRSPFADVIMADPSVATHHAELILTEDGRLHLTDCGSETGTWRLDASANGDKHWRPVRQSFVTREEPLKLGDHRCTAGQLVESARDHQPQDGDSTALMNERMDRDRPRLRGRVERDAATGEIVRRRP